MLNICISIDALELADSRGDIMKVYQHRRSVGQCVYHLVLVPKYRHKVFKDVQVKKTCEVVLQDIAKQLSCVIQAMEVMDDHVHLFLDINHKETIVDIFQKIKGTSSRIILLYYPNLRRRFFWKGHLWSKGKFFRSVGCVTDEVVKKYIEQSQHKGLQKTLRDF
jgi:putative transposase